MDTLEEGSARCGGCDRELRRRIPDLPLPPVPLPDHVFWGGYLTSLGTGVLSYAESTHSLNHSASLAGLW